MAIQVLIIDDSPIVRKVLSDIIGKEAGLALLDAVENPFEAVNVISKRVPDVIVLDIEMPKMDGLTFLRRIMAQKPVPVIICSTLVGQRSELYGEALKLGAVDAVAKPSAASETELREAAIQLTDRIRAAAQVGRKSRTKKPAMPIRTAPKLTADALLPPARAPRFGPPGPLIVIGASTGGVQTIERMLRSITRPLAPILIVQHMPAGFTSTFAQRLDASCAIDVAEAKGGDDIRPGLALIAPGDRHLTVVRRGPGYTTRLLEGPLISRHRPSVDVLFRSATATSGNQTLAVLLTGMGDDGARGMQELHTIGARTIVQSEDSCIIFGMPAEAIKRGCVDEAASPERIAKAIEKFSGTNRPRSASVAV